MQKQECVLSLRSPSYDLVHAIALFRKNSLRRRSMEGKKAAVSRQLLRVAVLTQLDDAAKNGRKEEERIRDFYASRGVQGSRRTRERSDRDHFCLAALHRFGSVAKSILFADGMIRIECFICISCSWKNDSTVVNRHSLVRCVVLSSILYTFIQFCISNFP